MSEFDQACDCLSREYLAKQKSQASVGVEAKLRLTPEQIAIAKARGFRTRPIGGGFYWLQIGKCAN